MAQNGRMQCGLAPDSQCHQDAALLPVRKETSIYMHLQMLADVTTLAGGSLA